MSMNETNANGLTANLILSRLEQRVTMTNARLLLNTVKIQTGINVDNAQTLDPEQTKAICLKLINQGGPSFQVGQALYKEFLM